MKEAGDSSQLLRPKDLVHCWGNRHTVDEHARLGRRLCFWSRLRRYGSIFLAGAVFGGLAVGVMA